MDLSTLYNSGPLMSLVGLVVTGVGGWFGARWTERAKARQAADERREEHARQIEELRLKAEEAARARIPEVQETLNAAVGEIVKHYKEALENSVRETAEFRQEVHRLSELVINQTKRLAEQSEFLNHQKEVIEELERHIEELTEAMKQKGIAVPELPPLRKRLRMPYPVASEKSAASI